MNPLEAAVLVAVLVLPFHGLVLWQIGRLQDPAYLREHGIVVVRESALDGHTEAVGHYAGSPIWVRSSSWAWSIASTGLRARGKRNASAGANCISIPG